MKILFIHEVGYQEKPIFEMHEFPEYLAARGHKIGFLDFLERRTSTSDMVFGGQVSGRVKDGVQIQIFSQRSAAPGILGRLLGVFAFPLFFIKVLRQFDPELVVSFSVPTTGWQAAIICKYVRIPLVFRALDVSHKIRGTFFAPLVKIAERMVYSTATHVSCNNAAMLSYCRSLGANANTSSVDFPPLDMNHFLGASSGTRNRVHLGIGQHEKVLLYMGSFFYFSGLDEVIRGLTNHAYKPHLVLVGGGELEVELRKLTIDLGLQEWVTFTGYVDFAKLPEYLSMADVAINPMIPSLVSNTALPNKVLQYMASGLPVVTTQLAGLNSLFPEEPGIKYVSRPKEVLGAALEMIGTEDLERLGQQNRVAVSDKFDLQKSVDKFEEVLKKVRTGQ